LKSLSKSIISTELVKLDPLILGHIAAQM